MRTVFFQGTFDILNAGHVRAFKIARAKGDRLIVGLNSDSPVRWIDKVVECHEPSAFRYVKRLKADVYVLTDEWEAEQEEAIVWVRDHGGKVVFSPRAEGIFDSSMIRARVVTINLGKEGRKEIANKQLIYTEPGG